jgi:hypothetical protein
MRPALSLGRMIVALRRRAARTRIQWAIRRTERNLERIGCDFTGPVLPAHRSLSRRLDELEAQREALL